MYRSVTIHYGVHYVTFHSVILYYAMLRYVTLHYVTNSSRDLNYNNGQRIKAMHNRDLVCAMIYAMYVPWYVPCKINGTLVLGTCLFPPRLPFRCLLLPFVAFSLAYKSTIHKSTSPQTTIHKPQTTSTIHKTNMDFMPATQTAKPSSSSTPPPPWPVSPSTPPVSPDAADVPAGAEQTHPFPHPHQYP